MFFVFSFIEIIGICEVKVIVEDNIVLVVNCIDVIIVFFLGFNGFFLFVFIVNVFLYEGVLDNCVVIEFFFECYDFFCEDVGIY